MGSGPPRRFRAPTRGSDRPLRARRRLLAQAVRTTPPMDHTSQPDLFQRGAAAPVDVTPSAAEHAGLARRLPPALRLGTSSWSFPGWAGLVWDRPAPRSVLASHGLAAYARHPLLRTVCVDRTYYEPLPAAAWKEMADQVPDDFRFVAKMDRRLTFTGDGRGADADLFLNPAWASEQVVGPALEGLGRRLGALLLQFPPTAPRALGGRRGFAERLYRFLRDLGGTAPVAVELRTPELLGDDYREALRHGGAGHGFVVHPRMADLATQMRVCGPAAAPPGTAAHPMGPPSRLPGPLVIRWMLAPGATYEAARDAWEPFERMKAPDPERREAVARLALAGLAAGAEPLVVVNNKAEGSSPASVVELARHLAGRREGTGP